MTPCAHCGSFVRTATACPTCGAKAAVRVSVTAVLLGLAVAGCTGDGGTDTTENTGETGITAPTTGVDYGVMMMAPFDPDIAPPERAPDEPEILGPQ